MRVVLFPGRGRAAAPRGRHCADARSPLASAGTASPPRRQDRSGVPGWFGGRCAVTAVTWSTTSLGSPRIPPFRACTASSQLKSAASSSAELRGPASGPGSNTARHAPRARKSAQPRPQARKSAVRAAASGPVLRSRSAPPPTSRRFR